MRDDDASVTQAAAALGTSPQTIRTLLRKGELRGRKKAWGSRYVWVPSWTGIEEFLVANGRLDGRRRTRSLPEVSLPDEPSSDFADEGGVTVLIAPSPPTTEVSPFGADLDGGEKEDSRPFVLRPRGRATVLVVLLGVPLTALYIIARFLPSALWFDEIGQTEVFRGVLIARVTLFVVIGPVVALFVGINMAAACRTAKFARTPMGMMLIASAALVTGGLFASSGQEQWQTFLLWWNRQSFGITDPVSGKDVGFFVFSLPFERQVSGLLLWLLAVTVGLVVGIYALRGIIGVRPRRAKFDAQVHIAILTALILLVLAWRLHLSKFGLELRQPSIESGQVFPGATYVDVHVRWPGLTVLSVLCAVLATVCVATPFIAQTSSARRAMSIVGVPGVLLLVGIALVGTWIPALVQRYVVDPNPLLSEQPYLEHSITSTRRALGLDAVDVRSYAPDRDFTATDFQAGQKRFADVAIWDSWLLEDRMQQLVTETPYYRPEHPSLDVVSVDGRQQPTVVSPRELDLGAVRAKGRSWSNSRLAYTHGLGLIRYSTTDIDPGREPRLLDSGLGVAQPRIYFGNLHPGQGANQAKPVQPTIFTPTIDRTTADSWVLVDTKRAEVDVPVPADAGADAYHYDGAGGIQLMNWSRRAVFAMALGSKELILSDDITPQSRLLLHRDVHDRLTTLAPFIQWDSHAVPLTQDGRIVFVVDGYTTSQTYPYAQNVTLGRTKVNYARASVRATVDAFSGEVHLYLVDPTDPVAHAWASAFPSLLESAQGLPLELSQRMRYPEDLFDAQASIYERFHATDPDVFASDSDVWARPIALAGSIEVAGDVDFDQDDEDNLRLTMQPAYAYAPPPGQTQPQIVLRTFYSPRRGQNLVASLSGWIDDRGVARLGSWSVAREPVTLGPAQISRLVFATPRVRNLLGLRNLEIRDVQDSSLDAVLLGQPHLLFTPGGVIQIQSLYEGSRGPGAARLLGVTAFVNGQAGLGPTIQSAVRQALNEPPLVSIDRPRSAVVSEPLTVSFDVENARREIVTLSYPGGSSTRHVSVANGRGTLSWVPPVAGVVRVSVDVLGLDGTRITRTRTFQVKAAPPTIRLIDTQAHATVGHPLRLFFRVENGVHVLAQVSTRSGVVFSRRYLIHDGIGLLRWTPKTAGPADLVIKARGGQGQKAIARLHLLVSARESGPQAPTVTLTRLPKGVTVGAEATIGFDAANCSVAVVRMQDPSGVTNSWRVPCTSGSEHVDWSPSKAGNYQLTITANGGGTRSGVQTSLKVGREP